MHIKVSVSPFKAENGDLMGLVTDGAYEGPKKGDIILLSKKAELDGAKDALRRLVESVKK